MLIRLFRTYLLPYSGLLWAVVALQFVQTMATLLLPTLNADIIDKGIVTGNTGYIWRMGAVMLVVTFVQVVFAIWATYYGAKAAMGFGRDVRKSLFHRVTGFSAQEVGEFGAPSLITRITNDVQQVQMLVVMLCTLFVAAPIMIVGGSIMAVHEDGPLSLILVVAIPVLVVSVGLVVVRLVPQFQFMQERIDRVNQVLREQITGIRVVRAFIREPEEVERFGVANDSLTLTSLRAGRLMAFMFPTVLLILNASSVAAVWFGVANDSLTLTSLRAGRLMAFMFPTVLLILNASSVAAVWFGGDRIGAGKMQIGALIAFLSYLVQILMSVMMATFVAVMWPRASVCAVRIKEVLDTPSSVVTAANPVTSLPTSGTLELRGVGFNYPGAAAPVLTDISFTARPGQTTAIIGSTGSGKTTLLNLVPRLFDATSGTVLVDGVDVRDLDPELLWSRIGLVPQKPYLFSGTVASNLRYADPDATDEELWKALEIAQARDFVAAMPGGLDATIAQGGTSVSGGQRQRLAIARALVRKPGIYLFDDSFSALDLATDARLRAALAPVVADATVVIVAQRVSTIANADQILVIEDGRQVGLGTHHELLASCPTYGEIVASQLTAEEAA